MFSMLVICSLTEVTMVGGGRRRGMKKVLEFGEGEKGCWKMMMARDFFEHSQRPTELEMLMSIEDGGVVVRMRLWLLRKLLTGGGMLAGV